MNIIKKDFTRKKEIYINNGGSPHFLRIMLSDGASAMLLYRLMSWFYQKKLLIFAFVVQWLNKFINGCVIGVGADFGEGLVIMHPVGVVINSKVRGGRNITIEGGVVIGDEKGMSPTLGENIFVGSGAKVFGDIHVGDYVKIGANAVVTKSATAGTTMVGVPAQEL